MSKCQKGGLSPLGEADERLPKVFNIESDPREEHDFREMHEWVIGPLLKAAVELRLVPKSFGTRRPLTWRGFERGSHNPHS